MANSVVDIYNMALNAVGTRDDVSSPNEASREAEVCRRWFANARDLILRAAFWPSAEAHSRLSVLAERDETEAWTSADPSPGFRFAYAVPSDLLVPRYQADFGRFVFSTYGDSRAVMSNTEQVVLAYTRQQTNVSLWDHALLMAIVYSLGAHIAIVPRETDPYGPLPDLGGKRVNLIYENVGLPGMLQRIIESAPFDGRIVMGGYCMEPEPLYVFAAQNKRLNIQFAGGEEPQDMDLAMRSIADGRIDVTPWLGKRIGLGAVAGAIANLSGPGTPVRTVVDPRLL